MSAFVPVACQHCRAPLIGRCYTGMSSWRCRKCKHWTTAGRTDKGELHYLQVDKPLLATA